MACDHIALTVKSHIDETDWNIAAAKDGTEIEASDRTPPELSEGSTSVDDAVRYTCISAAAVP